MNQEAAGPNETVSRETQVRLERYVSMLERASHEQNLVSRATLDDVWQRHIRDSLQLAKSAPSNASWIDIGSGAGLPGLVLAIAGVAPMTLLEPRRLRVEFLQAVINQLQLDARVIQKRAEQATGSYDVITARAVAPLSKLLAITQHLAHAGTTWILPKGRNAKSELAEAEGSWHYDLRVEPSCTDPDSRILILGKVRAR